MRAALLPLLGLMAHPAAAEVVSATDAGFEITHTTIVPASPAQVYAALGKIGQWWSAAHSYSGDARNMTIRLSPGGCFCEALPKDKGGVEHGRVVYAQPGKALRLNAALGPLQAEGVVGAITWTLKAKDGGTEIRKTYVVGGFVRGGAKAFAGPVNQVIGEQLTRLAAFVARR